jgi:hypothetical protein
MPGEVGVGRERGEQTCECAAWCVLAGKATKTRFEEARIAEEWGFGSSRGDGFFVGLSEEGRGGDGVKGFLGLGFWASREIVGQGVR